MPQRHCSLFGSYSRARDVSTSVNSFTLAFALAPPLSPPSGAQPFTTYNKLSLSTHHASLQTLSTDYFSLSPSLNSLPSILSISPILRTDSYYLLKAFQFYFLNALRLYFLHDLTSLHSHFLHLNVSNSES